MKILSITAGAAGMYCGSCMRDNALAAELLRRGHDITLQPVYTPTRPDEPNVSERRVLFSGISVYVQQRMPFMRSLPRFMDRLWDSPAVIRAFAGRGVSTDARLLGDLTISMLEGQSGVLRREFDKLLTWARAEPAPDVINLPNTLLIALARPLREAFDRPVCCTLQGEELFLEQLVPPYRDRAKQLIRDQIGDVDAFAAVSHYCARFMTGYLGIPARQLAVVPLGINASGYTRRTAMQGPFVVGYFARVAPEKGLHVLAEAYVRLRRRTPGATLRLEAAGYLQRSDAAYLARVQQTLNAAGLAGEFTYHGEVDRRGKLDFLGRLDVLSVPATYDEPKGMFLLEAMARGVPVVQPRRGAFTEIVETTGGGLLVDKDDEESLADGLHRVWQDRSLASTLADRAFDGVRAHYSIESAAETLLHFYTDAMSSRPTAEARREVH